MAVLPICCSEWRSSDFSGLLAGIEEREREAKISKILAQLSTCLTVLVDRCWGVIFWQPSGRELTLSQFIARNLSFFSCFISRERLNKGNNWPTIHQSPQLFNTWGIDSYEAHLEGKVPILLIENIISPNTLNYILYLAPRWPFNRGCGSLLSSSHFTNRLKVNAKSFLWLHLTDKLHPCSPSMALSRTAIPGKNPRSRFVMEIKISCTSCEYIFQIGKSEIR